jgi:hypothetical protein
MIKFVGDLWQVGGFLLTMFDRRIVEFLHKRTRQFFFPSCLWRVGGFFHCIVAVSYIVGGN